MSKNSKPNQNTHEYLHQEHVISKIVDDLRNVVPNDCVLRPDNRYKMILNDTYKIHNGYTHNLEIPRFYIYKNETFLGKAFPRNIKYWIKNFEGGIDIRNIEIDEGVY